MTSQLCPSRHKDINPAHSGDLIEGEVVTDVMFDDTKRLGNKK